MRKIVITLLLTIVTVSDYCQILVNSALTRGELPGWYTPRNVEPIEPLITTHWNQCAPYNDSISKKRGICVSIAYAQVMHYYRVKGSSVELYCPLSNTVLPPTTFNHELILDEYDSWSSVESRQEVAKLIKYCMNGFNDGTNMEEAFGFRKISYSKSEIGLYFPDLYKIVSDTHEFLDSCLSNSIPVIALGSNDYTSHFLIIDGRDSEGLYHINWGWGGQNDGYYAIADGFGDYRTSSYFDITNFITFDVDGWTATSVKAVRHPVKGGVYDLQGHKVGNSLEGQPNGIYIMNGKKYIVR